MSGTYEPRLYDIITPPDFRGDVDWYRRRALASGGPVLELGAGTGRITLAIAQAGVAVYALDSHPAMLAALRRKLADLPEDVQARVTVVEADMTDFDIRQHFSLVIAPFRAFLHNLTAADQLHCLRRVHQHLRPGGSFAFNVFHPSLEFMAQHAGALTGVWRWTGNHDLPGGGRLVRSEATRYDTVRQVVYSQHRYEEYGDDGTLTRTFLHSLELAYLYPSDIRRLLEQAGFVEVEIWGGFDQRPLHNDEDELVITATRRQ
jgi:SAM-dependent methyltransferase